MLCKRIIPCLDIKDGRVVKGVNFFDIKDAGDALEVAQRYDKEGADELIFLDISASVNQQPIMLEMISHIAQHIFIPFTVGGGIRSLQDIRQLLNAGADKVSINSSAVRTPNLINEAADKVGNQCIVVAIDAKRVAAGSWQVYINGGRVNTGIDVLSWSQEVCQRGAGEILLTSIDQDGTGLGFDVELTRMISENVPVPVIASGGAGNIEHLVDGVKQGKADAVLAASIFHYNHYTIKQAKQLMQAHGITVRLD